MHPEGINWIWECPVPSPPHPPAPPHDPPGQTNTPAPSSTPTLPLAHTHPHLLVLLYSSHALQKCLTPTPPPRHPHTYPTLLEQPVPHSTHSHTHMRSISSTANRSTALGYSCFHGSHVFCTCGMRRSRLRGHSYWFSGWPSIGRVCSCTPTRLQSMCTRPRIRGAQTFSIRMACGVAKLLAGSVIGYMLVSDLQIIKGEGHQHFRAQCASASVTSADIFFFFFSFFIFKCDAKLLGNQLVGTCKEASVNENQEESRNFIFQFQLILFPSWKKRKTD